MQNRGASGASAAIAAAAATPAVAGHRRPCGSWLHPLQCARNQPLRPVLCIYDTDASSFFTLFHSREIIELEIVGFVWHDARFEVDDCVEAPRNVLDRSALKYMKCKVPSCDCCSWHGRHASGNTVTMICTQCRVTHPIF